ncbi:protein WALLS ARE THIN 1 [Daucus carota subsp. sativus]|uniref:protein WALLS ARE THIN 1 n=1 Tax=Daucus carota subsp. sativus TaxID=79200 RepID=UPI0007F02B95|nr:PREDICTED: protein WALLS ARE THIN 1-like isoform X2 [Daucus carota subsp. sativus]
MFSSVPERVQLHIAMIIFQIGYAGNHIILRIALNVGISKLVFLIYRITIGLLLLSPFAYFLEKKDRPALNASYVLQFFVLGLVGVVLNNGSYFIGLENTSPVFASTIENSVPAITFALAAIFRIEEVNLRRKDGFAMVFGTFACVAGALIITLYRGPIIYSPDSGSHQLESMSFQEDTEGKNWALGCVSLVIHCVCWASWIVLQAPVVKNYPARLSIACYTFLFAIMQFLAIAAFTERNIEAWKIHSQSELLCVIYAGVVASGLAFAIQIWVVERGGPMLVAAYLPLQTLVAAVMASVFLSEAFSLGSIIGAVLIILGLYLVVWGKNEENKIKSEIEPLRSMLEKNCLPGHEKSLLVEPLMVSSNNF